LFAGGFLNFFSIACSTEKDPGFCRGGNWAKHREMLRHDALRRNDYECVLNEPSHVVTGLMLRRLHAHFGERSGVFTFLFAPSAETRIFSRRIGRGRDTLHDAARTICVISA
jgi:hypothetical protein